MAASISQWQWIILTGFLQYIYGRSKNFQLLHVQFLAFWSICAASKQKIRALQPLWVSEYYFMSLSEHSWRYHDRRKPETATSLSNICKTSMTNIQHGRDSNPVLLNFEPQPDRKSHWAGIYSHRTKTITWYYQVCLKLFLLIKRRPEQQCDTVVRTETKTSANMIYSSLSYPCTVCIHTWELNTFVHVS